MLGENDKTYDKRSLKRRQWLKLQQMRIHKSRGPEKEAFVIDVGVSKESLRL
jgi:hypothetical protein